MEFLFDDLMFPSNKTANLNANFRSLAIWRENPFESHNYAEKCDPMILIKLFFKLNWLKYSEMSH